MCHVNMTNRLSTEEAKAKVSLLRYKIYRLCSTLKAATFDRVAIVKVLIILGH